MKLRIIQEIFTICKIADIHEVNFEDEFYFLSKTDEELSLVCSTAHTPSSTISRDDGWRGIKIQGSLELSLVGILSKITGVLAERDISIFAISTYNTDYVLVRSTQIDQAVSALVKSGYDFVNC